MHECLSWDAQRHAFAAGKGGGCRARLLEPTSELLLPCSHPPQIIGANTVEITFDDTAVKLAGGLQGWLDNIPRFSLPKLPDILQVGGGWLPAPAASVPQQGNC